MGLFEWKGETGNDSRDVRNTKAVKMNISIKNISQGTHKIKGCKI